MSSNLNFTNQFHDYGLPKPSAANPTDFMINIKYLEDKINATTKELTYWDLYRISSVLTDANAFNSAINDLLPYSSLIVNTKGSTGKENGDYNPGDIFIKHNDGTYTKIKAERGGIFYPNKITRTTNNSNNYTYDISYQYAVNTPSKTEANSVTTEGGQFTCEYANTMTYKGIIGGLVGSPYNKVYYRNGNNKIPPQIGVDGKKNTDGQYVAPIVKCFTETNNQLEEVYCDIEIDYQNQSNKTYTIKLASDAPNLITRVVVK